MNWKRIWKKLKNDQAIKLFGYGFSTFLLSIGFVYGIIIVPDKLTESLQAKVLNDAVSYTDPIRGGISPDDLPNLKNDWLVIPSDVLWHNSSIHWFIKDLWGILTLVVIVLFWVLSFMLSRIAKYRKKLVRAKMIPRAWYDPFLFNNFTSTKKKVKEFADDPR